MPEAERRCHVISEYHSCFPDPIVLGAGDRLMIEDRETEWSGWLWCTTDAGKTGWVPADYVKRHGHKGEAIRGYDATELTVSAGEELAILEEAASWYWCRAKDGGLGWVPKQNVEILKTR